MSLATVQINDEEVAKTLAKREGHFLEFKRISVKPAQLTKDVVGLCQC
jgi:hypothetical protein